MRNDFRRRASAALAAWLAASAPAWAQDRDPAACAGDVSSVALAAMPAGAAFRVDLYDDRAENLRFRDAFLAALDRSGRRVAADGTLIVTFDAETYDAGPPRPSGRGRLTPLADETSSTGTDLDRLSNVEPRGRPGSRKVEAHVNVQVRNQVTGQVVWTADVHCRELSGTREEIGDSIIRAVIGVFGKTVSGQPL